MIDIFTKVTEIDCALCVTVSAGHYLMCSTSVKWPNHTRCLINVNYLPACCPYQKRKQNLSRFQSLLKHPHRWRPKLSTGSGKKKNSCHFMRKIIHKKCCMHYLSPSFLHTHHIQRGQSDEIISKIVLIRQEGGIGSICLFENGQVLKKTLS